MDDLTAKHQALQDDCKIIQASLNRLSELSNNGAGAAANLER